MVTNALTFLCMETNNFSYSDVISWHTFKLLRVNWFVFFSFQTSTINTTDTTGITSTIESILTIPPALDIGNSTRKMIIMVDTNIPIRLCVNMMPVMYKLTYQGFKLAYVFLSNHLLNRHITSFRLQSTKNLICISLK